MDLSIFFVFLNVVNKHKVLNLIFANLIEIIYVRMTFFDKKRDWSIYKDQILSYYLTPYLAKIWTLQKPIRVFDCFAGPGKFCDGSPGSPLLISAALRKAQQRGANVKGDFSEPTLKHYKSLSNLIQPYQDIVDVHHESFANCLPRIVEAAKTSCIFAYLDPFGIKDLEYAQLLKIFQQTRITSVEVLINYNFVALVRNAEACEAKRSLSSTMSREQLDAVCGNIQWRDIVSSGTSHQNKIHTFAQQYMEGLAEYFKYVLAYVVKETPQAQIPKYYLLFLSNSKDAVLLMNDNMCKAWTDFFAKSYTGEGLLFDIRTEDEKHDIEPIKKLIIETLKEKHVVRRGELIWQLILDKFGIHQLKHYRQAITKLLKEGLIFSSTGKIRINDDVTLSCNPFNINIKG